MRFAGLLNLFQKTHSSRPNPAKRIPVIGPERILPAAFGVADGVIVDATAVMPATLDFDAEGKAVIPLLPSEEGAVRIPVGIEEGLTLGATIIPPAVVATADEFPDSSAGEYSPVVRTV